MRFGSARWSIAWFFVWGVLVVFGLLGLTGCDTREALLITPLDPHERMAWRHTQSDATALARGIHEEALWLVGQAHAKAHCESVHGRPRGGSEEQASGVAAQGVFVPHEQAAARGADAAMPRAAARGAARPASRTINPNTATRSQLQRLPRVGPATALAIVEGRPYASVDELRRVKGIGPSTLEGIRPHLEIP